MAENNADQTAAEKAEQERKEKERKEAEQRAAARNTAAGRSARAAATNDDAATREARAKATIGAQRSLDPMSEEAIATRGGAADTMLGNIAARDAALAKQKPPEE